MVDVRWTTFLCNGFVTYEARPEAASFEGWRGAANLYSNIGVSYQSYKFIGIPIGLVKPYLESMQPNRVM